MIGAVILNYNNWEDTRRCIESIAAGPPEDDYRIILVDNASEDAPGFDLEAFLERHRIRLIRSARNRGYNAGNNIGIAQALKMGCSHILISNNDVRYFPGSIQKMKDCLDRHPEAGIAGPKILGPNGRLQKGCLCRRTGMKEKYLVRTRANAVFRKSRRSYFGYDRDYEKEFQAHAVPGCCFMMTRQCAQAAAPFDEHPFLYEEELMLGIRMEELGLATVYTPAAVIEHLHGASTRRRKAFAFAHNVRSEIYYCLEYLHAPAWQVFPLYLYRVLLYLARCAVHADFRRGWRQFLRMTAEEFHKFHRKRGGQEK